MLGLGVGVLILGAAGLGVAGLYGFELLGVEGLELIVEPGFGVEDSLDWTGLATELVLSVELGFSLFEPGLFRVSGLLLGYFPSAKLCALLLRAGRSTLFKTVTVGFGIFGTGGKFGAIFRYP